MTYEEVENRISMEDLHVLLNDAIALGENFTQNFIPNTQKKTDTILKKIRAELYEIEQVSTYGGEYKNASVALNLVYEYKVLLRKISFDMRAQTEQPNTLLGYLSYAKAEAHECELLDAGVDNISAEFTPQNMFVKLPLLNSKISYIPRGMGRLSSYENFFGNALRRAINNSKSLPIFEPYLLKKYEIFYLFLYKNRPPIIDNDNYATRDITNAIVSILPGADAPFACSFRFNSAVVNDIEEGTYVTVYPQSSPLSETAVMDFWRKYQQGKK